MAKSKSNYLWLALILLSIFLWFNRHDIFFFLQTRPSASSLDFNRNAPEPENKSTAVSTDEGINIRVFEAVRPAVVNIATTTLSMNFWLELIPREGQGSGFIIDRKGYILTNNHVVANAQKITVTMANGRKVSAALVGRGSDRGQSSVGRKAHRVGPADQRAGTEFPGCLARDRMV